MMDVALDFTELTEEDLGGLYKSTGWFKEKRKLTGILKDGPVGFVKHMFLFLRWEEGQPSNLLPHLDICNLCT